MATFRERLLRAMQHAGLNQSEVARQVTQLVAPQKGLKPQAVQYLVDQARHAQGSEYTVALAAVCGVRAEWLAHEDGPMLAVTTALPDDLSANTAQDLLRYAAQLSVAQQKELVLNLKKAADANEAAKASLQIPVVGHREPPKPVDRVRAGHRKGDRKPRVLKLTKKSIDPALTAGMPVTIRKIGG